MDHGNMGFPTSSIFFEAFLGETGIHLGDDDLVPCKVGRTGRSTRKEFSRPQERLTLLERNTSPNKASNIESMIFRTSRFFLGYDMDMYGFHMFQGTGTRINRHFLLIRSTQGCCVKRPLLWWRSGVLSYHLDPMWDATKTLLVTRQYRGDCGDRGKSRKWQERLDYRIIS